MLSNNLINNLHLSIKKMSKSHYYYDLKTLILDYTKIDLREVKSTALSLNNDKYINLLPKYILQINSLKNLILRGSNLTSIPKNIDSLKNLECLDISLNKLVSLSYKISKLENLVDLNCTSNKLVLIPNKICDLINLEFLRLSKNKLTKLPENIGYLENLKELSVHNNNLKILPLSITNLKKLNLLVCFKNNIKSIPRKIGNLQNLYLFNCSSNKLKTIPVSIILCKKLKYFDYDKTIVLSKQVRRFVKINIENKSKKSNQINNYDFNYRLNVLNKFLNLSCQVNADLDMNNLINEINNDKILKCQNIILSYLKKGYKQNFLMICFSELFWIIWSIIKNYNIKTQNSIKNELNYIFINYHIKKYNKKNVNKFCYNLVTIFSNIKAYNF